MPWIIIGGGGGRSRGGGWFGGAGFGGCGFSGGGAGGSWFNSIIKESLIVEFEDDKKTLRKLIFSIKPTIIPDGKGEDSDENYHFIEDNSTQKKMMKRFNLK